MAAVERSEKFLRDFGKYSDREIQEMSLNHAMLDVWLKSKSTHSDEREEHSALEERLKRRLGDPEVKAAYDRRLAIIMKERWGSMYLSLFKRELEERRIRAEIGRREVINSRVAIGFMPKSSVTQNLGGHRRSASY